MGKRQIQHTILAVLVMAGTLVLCEYRWVATFVPYNIGPVQTAQQTSPPPVQYASHAPTLK